MQDCRFFDVSSSENVSKYGSSSAFSYDSTEQAYYISTSSVKNITRDSIVGDFDSADFSDGQKTAGKAQAEIMKGNYREAVELINRIRNRAGLGNFNDIDTHAENADLQISQLDEYTLLEEVLNQKEMEFVGEGKRWYDLLWFGRIANNKYRKQFIDIVVEGNQTTNQAWIQSVLQDKNAWYMPLPQDDIDHNSLLVQNPYYTSTK